MTEEEVCVLALRDLENGTPEAEVLQKYPNHAKELRALFKFQRGLITTVGAIKPEKSLLTKILHDLPVPPKQFFVLRYFRSAYGVTTKALKSALFIKHW